MAVLPLEDRVIYGDAVAEGWSVEATRTVASDLTSSTFVHSGAFSHSILLKKPGGYAGQVTYVFDDPGGFDTFGYTHLEFYINGGEHSGQNPSIAGRKLAEWGVIPESDTWTRVSIPLPLSQSERLSSIGISGGVEETFYMDDMRLVAHPFTSVEVSEGRVVPCGYALSQNVPNPFNPLTTIAYDLPQACDVTLTVYALTGQKVGTLVSAHQEGGHYDVTWDGKGFGSGIYFYRLEAGEFVETKRMALLR
jgi:hypothetical protein